MSREIPSSKSRGRALGLVTLLAVPAFAGTVAFAQSKGPMDEVTITVLRVKALDKIDQGNPNKKADFFARASIGGTTVKSDVSKGNDDIKPNWKLKASVPRGKTNVKLEILDKDILTPADAIDINRLNNKRDLDFTVDTANCRIEGFSGGYRCGTAISRAGAEKRRAAVTFRVDVVKGK